MSEDGCRWCPDGHREPTSKPWNVRVSESPQHHDGDGQPLTILVCRPAGEHVAESDAEWIYRRINHHVEPHVPRRFHLQRDHDVSGVTGTGRVADGVQWPDGTATVRWCSDKASTVHWDRIEDAVAIHGHGGATCLVWDD